MANVISSERVAGAKKIRMSNGLTAVVFDVLALAACARARTESEKKLAYFLAQHDQSRIGVGCADLEIATLGWSRDEFEAQKRFVLAVIDDAAAHAHWELLPFTPNVEHVAAALAGLRALVEGFRKDAIAPEDEYDWTATDLPSRGACEVHGVYLHELGCIVCNDAPIDVQPALAPHRQT